MLAGLLEPVVRQGSQAGVEAGWGLLYTGIDNG